MTEFPLALFLWETCSHLLGPIKSLKDTEVYGGQCTMYFTRCYFEEIGVEHGNFQQAEKLQFREGQ